MEGVNKKPKAENLSKRSPTVDKSSSQEDPKHERMKNINVCKKKTTVVEIKREVEKKVTNGAYPGNKISLHRNLRPIKRIVYREDTDLSDTSSCDDDDDDKEDKETNMKLLNDTSKPCMKREAPKNTRETILKSFEKHTVDSVISNFEWPKSYELKITYFNEERNANRAHFRMKKIRGNPDISSLKINSSCKTSRGGIPEQKHHQIPAVKSEKINHRDFVQNEIKLREQNVSAYNEVTRTNHKKNTKKWCEIAYEVNNHAVISAKAVSSEKNEWDILFENAFTYKWNPQKEPMPHFYNPALEVTELLEYWYEFLLCTSRMLE